MGDDDWDLYAVVRGCRPAGSSATRDPFSSFPPAALIKAEEPVAGGAEAGFPDLFAVRTSLPELEELCRPFVSGTQRYPQPIISPHRSNPSPPSSASPAVVSSASSAVVSSAAPQRPRQQHRPPSQNSRSKRRKNQQKRVVCHVPADGASADMWAWRKYGQKPIKGSPYPRGYYRCSSSKGCPARKQVERSRADPGMLVITYTAEHNHPVPTHRNSLAGSTRNKFPTSSSAAAGPTAENPSSSPPSSSTAVVMSPTTPLTASMDEQEEEGMLVVEDMEMMEEEDVLFVGREEEFGVPTSSTADVGSDLFDDDGGFDDRFFPPLWLADNNAATAAGGS